MEGGKIQAQKLQVLDYYRSVLKKLKKTFFKKSNENGALEAYINLAREWESSDLPAYAGLSWNAAAKCENALGNLTGEVMNHIRSARQFALAEEKNVSTGFTGSGIDYKQASLNSYNAVIAKSTNSSASVVTLDLEIVKFLRSVGQIDGVEDYLNNALQSSSEGEFMRIHCLCFLASNLIEAADYLTALEALTEICNSVVDVPENGANIDILLECEISRTFLLLILKAPPLKLNPEMTKILERYTWSDRNHEILRKCRMSDYLFILLESLVTTCQSSDTSCLMDLETKLWPLLSTEQKNLLRSLVQIYYA